MGFEKIFNDFGLDPATAKAGGANIVYRREAMKWHPDKWTTKGTPEEKADAAEKFKEWNSKYDLFNSLFEETLQESRQGDLAAALSDTPRVFLKTLLGNPYNIKQKHEIKNALNHVYSFEELESVTKKDWTVFPAEQKEKIERSLRMTSGNNLKNLWRAAPAESNSKKAVETIFNESQTFNTTGFKAEVGQISNLFKSKVKIKEDMEKFFKFFDNIPFWLNETNDKTIEEIAEKLKSILSGLSRSELDALLAHFDKKPDIIEVLNLIIGEKEKEFISYLKSNYSEQSVVLLATKDWRGLDDESQEKIIKVLAGDLKKTLALYRNPSLPENHKGFIVENAQKILEKSPSSKLEKAEIMFGLERYQEAIGFFLEGATESVKNVDDIEYASKSRVKKGKAPYSQEDVEILQKDKTNVENAKQSLDKIGQIASKNRDTKLKTTVTLARLDIYIAERNIESERPWYKFLSPTKQEKIDAAKAYKDYLTNPNKGTLDKLKSYGGWFGALNGVRLGDIVEKQGGIPEKPPSQLAETFRDLGVDPNRLVSTPSQKAATTIPKQTVVPPVRSTVSVAMPEPLAPEDEKAIVPSRHSL